MSKSRQQLIAELSGDLRHSPRAGRTADMAAYWLMFNFIIAALLIYLTGPFRAGSLEQMLVHPQFLFESVTGLAAIIMLAMTAVRSGIPSNSTRLKRFLPALLLISIWLGFYVVGIWTPALEPSREGARQSHCYLETVFYGLPSLILGLYIIRRLWPLNGAWTGLMVGLAAGATPALLMQFACMYMPVHIITSHLLPGLLLGVVGLFAGRIYLKRR